MDLSEINDLAEELWPSSENRWVVDVVSDSLGTDVHVSVNDSTKARQFSSHSRVALSETWLELQNIKRARNGY